MYISAAVKDQFAYLMAGVSELLPNDREALATALQDAQSDKRPLRVKLGIDPTGSDLHLGHTVCLQLLRKFQDLGHLPVLIIGGFTARLGDPSGRNEARPPLSAAEVEAHSQTFLMQAAKVLDLQRVEVVNNAEWFDGMSLDDTLKLASLTTVNRLVAKEAFGERLEAGYPLYTHELFYPLLQGYDSVRVRADIEIGGQDQRFNVLAGREIQKSFGQVPQLIMLTPLLVGLDGVKKMSKTADNYIALRDEPADIYGKTMSLPDEQILSWFRLLLLLEPEELQKIAAALHAGSNPRDLKMRLARALTSLYHNEEAAMRAEERFVSTFQKREVPADMPELALGDGMSLLDVLVIGGMLPSRGEAKRMLASQGVKVNGQKATLSTPLSAGDIVQVGKRKFLRLA